MIRRAAIRKFGIAALLVSGALAEQPLPAEPATAAIAGQYDGSQMEMAAYLELGADGRYRYVLSYGAVDEYSQGTWTSSGSAIVLTSDPAELPRFEYLGEKGAGGSASGLTIHLKAPQGLPLSLFSAEIGRADGSTSTADFGDDGLVVPLGNGEEVISIQLALPMFELVGERVRVENARGKRLDFAFRPNALGFKVFDHAVLPERDGGYVLQRFGRGITFSKMDD